MLPSRPRVLLTSRPAPRLLWGRASDFVSWLGISPSAAPSPAPTPQQPPPPRAEPPPNRLAARRVLRPQPSAALTFPSFQSSLDPTKRRAASSALGRFSQQLRRATADQLLDAWQVISQCKPFVVDRYGTLHVRLATPQDAADAGLWMMQIVPADAFARLAAAIGTRAMYVGETEGADVLVANEALVVGNLVRTFHDLDAHELAVAFFEAYDRDRSVWLQEQQLREAAARATTPTDDVDSKSESSESPGAIEHVTRLPRSVYSCHLRSLFALKQSKKLVRVFEDDEHQLERICSTVPNLYMLLHACFDEKKGMLARRAIDLITQHSPAAVVPLGCYELAIRTNLRDKKRGERELQTALHLARALQNDGGYVLKPELWSALIKVSLNMERPDCALEVFKSYRRHRILEYQTSFRQALRAACRRTDSTALDMMHFCWASYDDNYRNAKALLDEREEYEKATFVNREINIFADSPKKTKKKEDVLGLKAEEKQASSTVATLKKDAESELLNMLLWEMLKHRHAVPSLVEVLDLMEATGSKGGAVALRLAVVSLFDYDMKQKKLSPREAVENSLTFWDRHSSVLSGQGFLVHLLLDECVARQYDDECELLLDYLLDLGVVRVPVHSIVKVMTANEVRGRFEANVRIGEKLLEKLPQKARHKLREDFYERYLMSYFRLEQFDKVREQHAKLNLEHRYPHNEVIRTIVRDAADQ